MVRLFPPLTNPKGAHVLIPCTSRMCQTRLISSSHHTRNNAASWYSSQPMLLIKDTPPL